MEIIDRYIEECTSHKAIAVLQDLKREFERTTFGDDAWKAIEEGW